MGEEIKAQKGYSEMSFPKLQTVISEDSISLECILFLEIILVKILFLKFSFPKQKIWTINVISYSQLSLKMSPLLVEWPYLYVMT